jgi:hypothetical protein
VYVDVFFIFLGSSRVSVVEFSDSISPPDDWEEGSGRLYALGEAEFGWTPQSLGNTGSSSLMTPIVAANLLLEGIVLVVDLPGFP